MQTVHVLHIGKTGGTTLRTLLMAHCRRHPETPIRTYGHEMTLPGLRDEAPGGGAVFFVRDPVDRFVSAFNSRLRQGRPRLNRPWTPREQESFAAFPKPNALAEALSADDGASRRTARHAMQHIGHVSSFLSDYLGSLEVLEAMRERIVFIGDFACFEEHLLRVRALLGVDRGLPVATDEVGTHRTPAGMDRTLSESGRENVARWYARDYPLYRWCLARRRALVAHLPERASGAP